MGRNTNKNRRIRFNQELERRFRRFQQIHTPDAADASTSQLVTPADSNDPDQARKFLEYLIGDGDSPDDGRTASNDADGNASDDGGTACLQRW